MHIRRGGFSTGLSCTSRCAFSVCFSLFFFSFIFASLNVWYTHFAYILSPILTRWLTFISVLATFHPILGESDVPVSFACCSGHTSLYGGMTLNTKVLLQTKVNALVHLASLLIALAYTHLSMQSLISFDRNGYPLRDGKRKYFYIYIYMCVYDAWEISILV